MTCSSSSNIKSTTTFVNITQGGSRLMMTVMDGAYALGITAGDVIRYKVPSTSQYVKSIASALDTSEVVGIVESKSSDNLNVVIYGSINLPASAIESSDADTTVDGGGNDVYFLSATTAGKVRVTAPIGTSDIIKPIYQVAPHGNGSYTGIVMNYIGYRVGGDIQAFLQGGYDGGVGTVSSVLSGAEDLPTYYVDASISHTLPLSQYGSFWSKFGKSFGTVDKMTLAAGQYSNSSHVGKTISTSSSTFTGTIISSVFPNEFYIRRPPNGITGAVGTKFIVEGHSDSMNILEIETYAVLTPIISNPFGTILAFNGISINQPIITGIKVAGDGTTVTIPHSASITLMTADSLVIGSVGGSGGYDVEDAILSIEERLDVIEARLLI